MDFLKNKKSIFLKNVFFVGSFLIFFIFYIFLLNFYENKILNQLKEISSLKAEIINTENQIQNSIKLQRINNLIKQKTGQELKSIIYQINQKLNKDFETTKNIIVNKLNNENWSIKTTNFQKENNFLEITLELSLEDLNKFFNFLTKEGILWQIQSLNISKLITQPSTTSTNIYTINFSIKTK